MTRLFMESRQQVLDRRDVLTVQQARFDLPKRTSLHVEHRRGAAEPRLWVADVVAGVVRTHRQGDSTYRELLGDRLHVIEVSTVG